MFLIMARSNDDDYISSEELFQSFMDVALIAEQEIRSAKEECTLSEAVDFGVDKKVINNNVHLPLLLRKSAEPIYESVSDTVLQETEIYLNPDKSKDYTIGKTDGTIVTVTSSPRQSSEIPLPDYPGAEFNKKDYDVVIESVSKDVKDMYAVVNKQHKTGSSPIPPIILKNNIDTEHQSDFNSETNPNVSSGNAYETIFKVVASDPITDIQTKTVPLSEYHIIGPQTTTNCSQTASNPNYESVNDLKLQLKNDELIPPLQDGELSPEIIAFGHPSQRLHSDSQMQIYQSCLSTIDRGARNSEKKRHFFGFGKSKQQDICEVKMENKLPTMNRQDSVIPVLCSGYLFKQGGTGITPKNWRLRWFELKKDNCLYYYKNEQDPSPAGAVMLSNYTVNRAVEANKRFSFKLAKGGGRTYYFAANSEEEMKRWMTNLGEAVNGSSQASIPECSLKNVSVPATSISEPDCHGYLWKQGNIHKSWRRRYCVLKYGCLFYYEEMSDQCAIGVFKLQNYTVSELDMRDASKHGIRAVPPGRKMRTYYFYAESEIDWRRWIEALKFSITSIK